MNVYKFFVAPNFDKWLADQPNIVIPGEISFKDNLHQDGSNSVLNQEITITETEESGLTLEEWSHKCHTFLVPLLMKFEFQSRKY